MTVYPRHADGGRSRQNSTQCSDRSHQASNILGGDTTHVQFRCWISCADAYDTPRTSAKSLSDDHHVQISGFGLHFLKSFSSKVFKIIRRLPGTFFHVEMDHASQKLEYDLSLLSRVVKHVYYFYGFLFQFNAKFYVGFLLQLFVHDDIADTVKRVNTNILAVRNSLQLLK